ncbi:hypothetical protein MMC12_003390 [Toensbergia leucococca]|nr:hypothetical protein [Toensbergia leucococca]
MALYEGIKVEVISGGQPLRMYEDPDKEENAKPLTCQHYIEAVTGAKFAVKVRLTDTFSVGHCDAVKFQMSFDGGPCWDFHIDLKSSVRNVKFSYITEYCKKTGQWKDYDLSFGSLNIQETANSATQPAQTQNLRMIRVAVIRANKIIRQVPRSWSRLEKPQRISQVSEKTMKGKAIANTVDLVGGRLTAEPPPILYDHYPVSGPQGVPIYFNILYRLASALRMLGCIPRSPSPESDAPVIVDRKEKPTSLANNSDTDADLHQEVKALRERLSLLERDTNVKTEPRSGQKRIKPEDDDLEIVEPPKRQRHSGPLETIDLTAD